MIALLLAGAIDFHPTRYDPDIAITPIARSRSDTTQACHELGAPTRADSRAGCARVDLGTRTCTIYFVRGTRSSAELHERTHCYFGRWHEAPE